VSATGSRYLIALGSNVRHRRHGSPRGVLRAALAAMSRAGLRVEKTSPLMASRPLGPSRRTYANAATVIATRLEPPAVLERLKTIERSFGRRRGRRWSQRVLDLDIVLWDGGAWSSPGLTIPHVAFRERPFVLRPALAVAADWRDPLTCLTVRQLARRRYNF
jgi:2-amino-4-hydroxy-6-hydroxymethyldihydropteridine diphosphokinase